MYMCTETLWERTDGMNKTASPASFHLVEQLQQQQQEQGFSGLFLEVQTSCCSPRSCATSSVELYCCSTPQICCFDKDIEPTHLVSEGCSLRAWRTVLSLVLVGHLTGKNHEKMKRRQNHHTLNLTKSDFHPGPLPKISASRTTSARSEAAPNSTRTLPNPQFLFNYETLLYTIEKLSKLFRHSSEGKRSSCKLTSCLPACLCMGRYFWLEPASWLLCVPWRPARAVTSTLASPTPLLCSQLLHKKSR